MLCSRSPSLMSTTRMSCDMARNILRMFSACCSSALIAENLLSLVTPSTRMPTSSPKRSAISAVVTDVSSGTSWSSAATRVAASRPRSARMSAASAGWVTYGSPEARTCVPCASTAKRKASSTMRAASAVPIPDATLSRSASRSDSTGRASARTLAMGSAAGRLARGVFSTGCGSMLIVLENSRATRARFALSPPHPSPHQHRAVQSFAHGPSLPEARHRLAGQR